MKGKLKAKKYVFIGNNEPKHCSYFVAVVAVSALNLFTTPVLVPFDSIRWLWASAHNWILFCTGNQACNCQTSVWSNKSQRAHVWNENAHNERIAHRNGIQYEQSLLCKNVYLFQFLTFSHRSFHALKCASLFFFFLPSSVQCEADE